MNRVEKVSIGGYAFTLEERAYDKLNEYLESLQTHYSSSPDCNEIVDAMEERLAELLIDNGGRNNVISFSMVEKVIGTLGNPEEQDGNRSQDSKKNNEENAKWWQNQPSKRFLRDTERRIAGGVCSGIAAYFRIDVVLVRLVFLGIVLASLILSDNIDAFKNIVPFILLLYPILWIVMPSPHTEKEKKSLRESYKNTSDGNFWSLFWRICRIAIGLILMMIGISGLMCCIMTLFRWNPLVSAALLESGWDDLGFICFAGVNNALACLAGKVFFGLSITLPFIFLLWEGVRMVFNLKPVKWHPGLICLTIWFIALLAFLLLSLSFVIPV